MCTLDIINLDTNYKWGGWKSEPPNEQAFMILIDFVLVKSPVGYVLVPLLSCRGPWGQAIKAHQVTEQGTFSGFLWIRWNWHFSQNTQILQWKKPG